LTNLWREPQFHIKFLWPENPYWCPPNSIIRSRRAARSIELSISSFSLTGLGSDIFELRNSLTCCTELVNRRDWPISYNCLRQLANFDHFDQYHCFFGVFGVFGVFVKLAIIALSVLINSTGFTLIRGPRRAGIPDS